MTAARSPRSAALLVGSTSSTSANVQSARSDLCTPRAKGIADEAFDRSLVLRQPMSRNGGNATRSPWASGQSSRVSFEETFSQRVAASPDAGFVGWSCSLRA